MPAGMQLVHIERWTYYLALDAYATQHCYGEGPWSMQNEWGVHHDVFVAFNQSCGARLYQPFLEHKGKYYVILEVVDPKQYCVACMRYGF